MTTTVMEKLTALDAIDGMVAQAAAGPVRSVFGTLCSATGLRAQVEPGDRDRIPRAGPVIFVCNHPSGFAEGLLVPALLDTLRGDVTTMAHRWFERWPALAERMILVDPQHEGRGNAEGMKRAVRWVRGGGSLLIMPAGEVAHGRPGSFATREKPWKPGLAALIRLTGATVVPIHVEASNRRRFHALSWLRPRWGVALLCRELLAQRGRTFRVRVGKAMPATELRAAGDAEAVTDRCRRAVLEMGGR